MTSWFLISAIICALCVALLSTPVFAASGKMVAPPHHLQKGKGKKKSIAERIRKDFPKWRGQELNKVLREVSRRSSARGNKFLKEGVSAHEGGAHKGHTISHHVAVSAKHLEARIEYEKRRSADKKQQTLKDHTALKMEHISSFKSLKEANRLVEKTLTDPQNKGLLVNWAKKKSAVDPKTGSKQFLELTLRDAGSVTGLAMHPKTKKLADARGVRVVLRRSNGKRGWAIVTAHPVVKAEVSERKEIVEKGRWKQRNNRATKTEKGFRSTIEKAKGDAVRTKGETAVIGRVKDLRDLREGERSLLDRLPDQGNPKANWKQNSGVLRQEMARNQPIRDASSGDAAGRFLNAERNLLRSHSWTFDPKTNYWNPPATKR